MMADALRFIIFVHILSLPGITCQRNLRLTHVLYRHGDRTPIGSYPTDPYKDYPWPQGRGQLTQLGVQQQLALGRWLREKYITSSGFMNGTYIKDEVLYMSETCTKYSDLYVKGLRSDEHERIFKENQDMIEYAAQNAGFEDLSFGPLWKLGDTLICQNNHNLTHPDWVTPELWDFLMDFVNLECYFWYKEPEMARLRGGPFVTEISNNIQKKLLGTMTPSNRKMFMYAAHDSTLSAVMTAMGIFNDILPPVASTLMWDLYDTPSGQIINILYRNETANPPYRLTLPGCEFDCPADQFLSILAPMKFEGDWRAACEASTGNISTVGVITIVIAAGALAFILTGMIVLVLE